MKNRLVNKITKVTSGVTALITANCVQAHAANMPVISVDGMDNVATSLQNFVKYLGIFFIAGGVATFTFGGYKLFQSIKNQDGDSRSNAILELAAGLGAMAVGAACATFASYITL